MQVTHSNFGQGTIVSQDDNNVRVDFNGTVKTLVIKFARLLNEDGSVFGTQFVAPEKKQLSAKKMAEKRSITHGRSPLTREQSYQLDQDRKYNQMVEMGCIEAKRFFN